MKKLIFVFVALAFTNLLNAQTNILFIGNEIISENNLSKMFKDLATSAGKTVYSEHYQGNPPNYLQQFKEYTQEIWDTRVKLLERDWDFVVLQENDQISGAYAGFGTPGFFEEETYNASISLNRAIRDTVECGEPIFFMTFGYRTGDTINYPGDTYLLQQERIRRNYILITEVNFTKVAPVGMAWKDIRIDRPEIDLYKTSSYRLPNESGTYLAACVLYATIFQETPVGISFHGTVHDTIYQYLQIVAENTVMDSFDAYHFNDNIPKANFTYSFNKISNQYEFTSSKEFDTLNVKHYWKFGDENTSTLQNPAHHFENGEYTITHIVYHVDDCYPNDTFTQTIVHVGIQGALSQNNDIKIYPNPNKGNFLLKINLVGLQSIDIYDLRGNVIRKIKPSPFSSNIQLDLTCFPKGVYQLRAIARNEVVFRKIIIQ